MSTDSKRTTTKGMFGMEEEYEIHHYGFSLTQLKKETKEMIRCEVDKSCDLLVESIKTNPLISNDVTLEIERKRNALTKEIFESFKDSLTQMENIISSNFSIPPNVTLSCDQSKLKDLGEDEEQLQRTFDEKMTAFMGFEQFKTTMKDELESWKKFDHVIDMQRRVAEQVKETLSSHKDLTYLVEQHGDLNDKIKEN